MTSVRWFMVPGYENRRTVPKAWHCVELEPGDEHRQDYPERPTLCGKTLRFRWKGSMVDSHPDPLDLSDLFHRARWKRVCSTCKRKADERRHEDHDTETCAECRVAAGMAEDQD